MEQTEVKNKGGRPTIFSQELADKICARLARGQSLRTVCKSDDLPDAASVFSWMRKYPEFLEQYTRAKQEATDALAEEIIDISDDSLEKLQGLKADDAMVKAQHLRIETRKWVMAKMKPKKYGDKVDLTTNGKDLPTPILDLSKMQEKAS